MRKGGLGKGLDSLISKSDSVDVSRETLLRIAEIEPNREQPRKVFDENAIAELSESIKEYGVIQPIIVTKEKGYYRIVAGERRWRAAKEAGLKKIPAIIKEYTDKEVSEIALIENLQREDLNPLEEAKGIQNLINEYGLKQEEIAKIISKSRPYITNSLRLLNLDPFVQELLLQKQITSGHAKMLAGIKDNELQIKIAKEIVEKGLSVRQVESIVTKGVKSETKTIKSKDVHIETIEKELEELLKVKININNSSKNRGFIKIKYSNLDELERIIEQLKG